jgi:serine/threonine-protein kinase HipA
VQSNRLAGRIEETVSGGSRFVYKADWTETIGCCLPVNRREHEWRAGLHPFFQHLGAEGWLRERQARVAHIAEEDDLGLLLRYGEDCIGAVGLLPAGAAVDNFVPEMMAAVPGRTVSGVQRKLLVVRDEAANTYRPAASTGPAPYIAKLNSDSRPTMVRNEALSLRWVAALLGKDEVSEFRIDRIAELGETALIVTRFDRLEDGSKLRAEDFSQVLCKPRGSDYGGKYEASYEEAAEAIRSHSVRPDIDLARFYRRLVAFVLISNADAHLKNFTLLERPEGLRLSPIYDVVNVGLYPEFSQQFALSICGNRFQLEAITRPLLTDLGHRIGVSDKMIARTFRDLRTRAKQASKVLPAPDDDGRDPFGARYTETVRNGCLRVLEE